MSIEQAWLVKGWLLGRDAPEPIMVAIGGVIAALRAPDRGSADATAHAPTDAPAGVVRPPDELPEEIEGAAPKLRKPWSDEARAAAAERMRARQAAKRDSRPGNCPAPSAGGA